MNSFAIITTKPNRVVEPIHINLYVQIAFQDFALVSTLCIKKKKYEHRANFSEEVNLSPNRRNENETQPVCVRGSSSQACR